MDTSIFLYIINIGLTFTLCVVHFFFTKKDFAANRMLTLFLLCIFYVSILLVMFSSRWILEVPHFYRTGNIFIYMMFPAAYLYTKKILNQEGWQSKDLLHFLPTLLYIIDFSPFFSLSAAEKVLILQEDYAKESLYAYSQSWLFPTNFHFFFRAVLAFGYLFFMAKLWVENFYNDSDFRRENRSLMQWLAVLILLLTIEVTPSLLIMIFGIPINLIASSNILSYGITVCFSLFLLFKPEIIYGVKGLWVSRGERQNLAEKVDMATQMEDVKGEALAEVPSSRKVYIKEEVVNNIEEAIEVVLMERKSFLNQGYSLANLSADTGYPTYQLSTFLNKHIGMNFSEYINNHRIHYLVKMLKEEDSWQRFTLQALGEQVGFSNRFSFLSAFKRVVGENPSTYLKTLKKFNGN
jgi:AraC-like DNA-binding protein